MPSRSQYDYSLWPEHARPRRKRFSLKAIATTLTILVVCGFAASVVYSELTQSSDPQALVGRTWPLQHVTEQQAQAQVKPPVQAAPAPGAVDPDAAKQAKPAPRPPVNVANRKLMPTIGTARPPETDGSAAAAPPPSAEPLQGASADAAATPPETTAEVPADSKPAAGEKPTKPHKKVAVHRRWERNTAAVASQVYDYPDGRRVTVYRRLNGSDGQSSGYNATSGNNGYSGYGGYNGYGSGYSQGNSGFGAWRPNYYAERPGGYRPY